MTLATIRLQPSENILSKNWYVIQTQYKQELIAKENLVRQGFVVFFPQYVKQTNKGPLLLPLFGGYLFANFDPEMCRWQSIHSTIGVSRILGYQGDSNRLIACRPGVIPGLQSFCDAQDIVDMERAFPSQEPGKGAVREFKEGDNVKILNGMFKGQQATYWNTTKDCHVVILSLLNRSIRVILPNNEIA